MIEAKMPNFLKINHIGGGKEKGEWAIVKVRINPYNIYCYMEIFIQNYNGQEIKKVVALHVANDIFIVDMTIEEADKMMEDIDRSLTFNEDEL